MNGSFLGMNCNAAGFQTARGHKKSLSFRTSAHAGVGIPRIFKQFGRRFGLFTPNGGIATPVTSVLYTCGSRISVVKAPSSLARLI